MDRQPAQAVRAPGAGREPPVTAVPERQRTRPERTSAWLHHDFASIPLRQVISSLPTSGGAPLPDAIGDDLARATGEADAGDGITVHNGQRSQRAAAALGAEAFTVGRDVHLASSASAGDRRLMLHEAAHARQQDSEAQSPAALLSRPGDAFEVNADAVVDAATRGTSVSLLRGAAGVLQRKVSDTVRDKLSYGVVDWAVTDQEATDALAMLAELPEAQLSQAVAELGSKYVSRLLDNVPAALKTGPEYQRVVQAAGTTRTMDFVLDRLSYGFFDWAITDEEVNEVYNVYANLSAAQQDEFWQKLQNAGQVDRLIDQGSEAHERLYVQPWIRRVPRGEASDPWQRVVMKAMIEETESAATADLLLETRFNVAISAISASKVKAAGDDKRTASTFSVEQMRHLWSLLEKLPPGHVADNPELDRITSYAEGGGAWYFGDLDEASIGGSGNDESFENNLRHEVGHSVDAKIGWKSSGEHQKAERGGWIEYAGSLDAAVAAVDLSDAAIKKLPAADRSAVEAEMQTVMDDHAKKSADLRAAIQALPFGAVADKDRDKAKAEVLKDKALVAVVQNRNIEGQEPWWRTDGGVSLGSPDARIVQEAYDKKWVSYDLKARTARGLTDYQFRAPAEWFAEVYTKYYTPGSDGRDLLHRKDPNTEKYFDDHVHGA